MNHERVKQLEEFIKENPNDPFLKYALALEHIESNNALAISIFRQLLSDHPDYLPSYFHAAQLLTELEENDEAKEVFEKGIELSKVKKDQKTLAELQNAYQNFLFDLD